MKMSPYSIDDLIRIKDAARERIAVLLSRGMTDREVKTFVRELPLHPIDRRELLAA